MKHKVVNRSKDNLCIESGGTLTKILPHETCEVTCKRYGCQICKIVFKGKWEIVGIYAQNPIYVTILNNKIVLF